MELPPDYRLPEVKSIDTVGYSRYGVFCQHGLRGGFVCTLPKGHWGEFHVAHLPDGTVCAVDGCEPWLELPEGF